MEAVIVTNLQLISFKNRWNDFTDDGRKYITAYSLKIDGITYRYQIFHLVSTTQLFKNPNTNKKSYELNMHLPMDVTNPQKTIEQFYKLLMLQ